MDIKISDIRDVGKILDYVHDRTFQLSEVRFDKASGILSIPTTVVSDEVVDRKGYFFFSKWKNPIVEAELRIGSVTNYTLKDEAEIGEGIINTISAAADTLIIKCSVPVEITAKTSTVDLELVLSTRVVGEVSRFSFGSPPNTEHA